ncbi:ABC transporter permease [Candidatus Phytoplasma solani]|uniref:ABC transporter permease n=1 Tax=Candidatus Phytoplasma solani TaxID=69896 RepID=UPI00358DDE79
MKPIDPKDFVFVNKTKLKEPSHQQPTKIIGYYKNAFKVFFKTKLTKLALFFLFILLLFTFIGPYINPLPEKIQQKNQELIKLLPPKIPLLEKLGIFNGTSKKTLYLEEIKNLKQFDSEIIKKTYQTQEENKATVLLDAYLYREYQNSLLNQTYTKQEYEAALKNNAIIESSPLNDDLYKVKVKIFAVVFNQSPKKTYFYFGTNAEGKDLFTEIWKGSLVSLSLAVLVSLSTLLIGVIIGAFCGYYGGFFDLIISAFVEFLDNLPFMALIMVLMLKMGSSFITVILIFLIKGWISAFYHTRAQFYRYKHKEYVIAARMLGASDLRIFFKHIFPNIIGILITIFALSIPSFIITEAIYSFVGVVKYPQEIMSIGQLLDQSFDKIHSFPYLCIFPISYLMLLMFTFNLLGNNLREAFNPARN